MNGRPVAPSEIPSRWDPSVICRALTTEECQGLLADAEWANKARKGDDEDIRPCIGCHTEYRKRSECEK